RSSGRARGRGRAGVWRPARCSWGAPGQADGRSRHGGNAFAASGEAELLAGGRLDADAIDRDAGDLGDALAHGVAMRTDLRGLAHDGEIEVDDAAAALRHALDRELQETVRGGTLPPRIARRKVRADVAVGERAENRVDQRMQPDVGVRVTGDAALVRDLH